MLHATWHAADRSRGHQPRADNAFSTLAKRDKSRAENTVYTSCSSSLGEPDGAIDHPERDGSDDVVPRGRSVPQHDHPKHEEEVMRVVKELELLSPYLRGEWLHDWSHQTSCVVVGGKKRLKFIPA